MTSIVIKVTDKFLTFLVFQFPYFFLPLFLPIFALFDPLSFFPLPPTPSPYIFFSENHFPYFLFHMSHPSLFSHLYLYPPPPSPIIKICLHHKMYIYLLTILVGRYDCVKSRHMYIYPLTILVSW